MVLLCQWTNRKFVYPVARKCFPHKIIYHNFKVSKQLKVLSMQTTNSIKSRKVSSNNERENHLEQKERAHSEQFSRIAPLITLELTERLLKVKATNEIRHMPDRRATKANGKLRKPGKRKRFGAARATGMASCHIDKVLMRVRVMWQIYRPPSMAVVAINSANSPPRLPIPKTEPNGCKETFGAISKRKNPRKNEKYFNFCFGLVNG